MKLTEAIEALCIATCADGRSPETVTAYQRKLKPLAAFLGDVPVGQVTTDDLRRFVAHLQARPTRWANHPKHEEQDGGLSQFTIASHVRCVKRLFNWLESEGALVHNPARRLKTPQPKRREPKAADVGDLLALLGTTEGEGVADRRDRALLLFLADTGCRLGGLCGLQVRDVDIDAALARVSEKGGQDRLVFFSGPTAAALRAWLAVRPLDQGPWLFVSLGPKARGKLSPNGVRQALRRRAKEAGVTGRVNPHAFRHAFAREYLLDRGDLASLSNLMGHSSVEVTASSYAIFTMQELQAKHRQHSPVARLLGGNGDGT